MVEIIGDGLGSGWAGQYDPKKLAPPRLVRAFNQILRAGKVGLAPSPDWAWFIDGSYYVKNWQKVITDAVAAGCSGVFWKASDAVQMIKSTSEDDIGAYIDPTFFAVVDFCYHIVRPDGGIGVPVFGYHFGHIDSYVPPFDPESPSSCRQWKTIKYWIGKRVIYGGSWDQEGYRLYDADGTYLRMNYEDTGKVVMADRLKTVMEWMRKIPDPNSNPYLAEWTLYTSPGFANSYMPNVVVDIDNHANYKLWLATWWFVKRPINSFGEVPALIRAVASLPSLGNVAEKTIACQLGTVAYAGTEVDINIVKKTQAAWYKSINFTGTPAAGSISASPSSSPSGEENPSTSFPSDTEVLELLKNMSANQTLMKKSLDEIRAHFK